MLARALALRPRAPARAATARRGASVTRAFKADDAAPAAPAPRTVRLDATAAALKVEFGEHLRLVGAAPELGAWDVAAAPELAWSEGHVWSGAP